MKEIRIKPRIAEHDLQTKICSVRRLVEKDKVKVQIFFRGREITHPEIGSKLLDRVIEGVKDISKVETRMEKGRDFFIILIRSR